MKAIFTALLVLAGISSAQADPKFEADRGAILAMAGDFKVSFDFRETIGLAEGYTLKEPHLTDGYEMVRVLEDRGDFISLQHILVADGPVAIPIKHWRQDWQYEPSEVLVFKGGNAWAQRAVFEDEQKGAWKQVVYQVDDSPRYGAVARWEHDAGVSSWSPDAEWRPLPRRDATKRDDYHTIDAINRHVITPEGWVHEQHNTKIALGDTPQAIAREIGVNRYDRIEGHDFTAGENYWTATADYWAGVRAVWSDLEAKGEFSITLVGEPEPLYQQLLGLADMVREGEMDTAEAISEANAIIADTTMSPVVPLDDRLAGNFEVQF